MRNALLSLLALTIFLGVASATSNTLFTHQGIAGGTQWIVNIFPATNSSSFNVVLAGTTNTLSTNALTSGSYSYVAGYTLDSVYTYIYESVNIGSNNIVNFTPNSNAINSNSVLCNHGQSLCAPVTGTLNASTSVLQNHILGPPYSANLTIYINPAGYYEYVVQNSSLGSNPKTQVPQSLYINVLPGQINNVSVSFIGRSYQVFNLSPSNSLVLSKNKTIAEIFYSQLIDISPIEYDMLGGNLTPQAFGSFVYANNENFLNSTIVYSASSYTASSATATSGFFGALQSVLNIGLSIISLSNPLAKIFGLSLSGLGNIPYAEATTSATQTVPVMLSTIPNSSASFPIYVSYAYPNFLCQVSQLNTGICIQSGQKGMLAFNNYIDDTYAPEILMNQFLTVDASLILGFALIMLIIKKINGE